ncbi:hypothetical protein T03_14123 [Trichinella britovi]|uniref:Uncharacterized protein n=1 Tax=Trichinella britovi TaxID=45882 RepID=A0A0V1CY66_TRIBR|nr:hypothetical protein T03_14123 [Trichinella britovi]
MLDINRLKVSNFFISKRICQQCLKEWNKNQHLNQSFAKTLLFQSKAVQTFQKMSFLNVFQWRKGAEFSPPQTQRRKSCNRDDTTKKQ